MPGPIFREPFNDAVHLRRRFVFTGHDLTDVFEEDFDDPDSLAGSGGVPDPLLAELRRARRGCAHPQVPGLRLAACDRPMPA